MDASLPRVMGMETCWLITLVPPEKIFAMRSGRHEAQSRAGRNYSPYSRGQILYRAAEMLEGRRLELENELARVDRSGAGRAAK